MRRQKSPSDKPGPFVHLGKGDGVMVFMDDTIIVGRVLDVCEPRGDILWVTPVGGGELKIFAPQVRRRYWGLCAPLVRVERY
jgi:hypothetical protein